MVVTSETHEHTEIRCGVALFFLLKIMCVLVIE